MTGPHGVWLNRDMTETTTTLGLRADTITHGDVIVDYSNQQPRQYEVMDTARVVNASGNAKIHLRCMTATGYERDFYFTPATEVRVISINA